LLNSSHIQRKIENSPVLQALFQTAAPPSGKFNKHNKSRPFGKPAGAGGSLTPREIVSTLYLTILSRFPTDDELKTVAEYVEATSSRREAGVDTAWALINSAEFLYRH
jgi:hypothetical protein